MYNLRNFLKPELENFDLKLSIKPNGREGQANSNIFIENNVDLMPSLSNWEIKVSSNTIPYLAKYAV
jgi:hypothetical protein